MDTLSIDEVERNRGDALLGGVLDAPVAGTGSDGYSFSACGWAIGRERLVEAFQVLDGDRVVCSAEPNRERPDVAEKFAGEAHAGVAGFDMQVPALELPQTFALQLVARLSDGSRAPLASIHGRRAALAVPRSALLDPVMITTIGRSGSKWLAWLLSCHRAVVAFQPLTLEPRVATYWMTVLRELAAPSSAMRQLHTDHWDERWWLGDGAGSIAAPVELGMSEWLGSSAVGEVAAFCQQRVECFYEEVAARSGGEGARYFAEKFLLDPVLLGLTCECFGGAREVILVRDFRDRLSSVFAWNERHHDHGFGHDGGMSKASYLTERVLGDACQLLQRREARGAEAHLVRYEDLVREPHATLAGLFEYLDIDEDRDTVDAVLEHAAGANALLDSHRTIDDPLATIGRWKQDLAPELAEECNELLAPVLEAFGYDAGRTAGQAAR